MVSPPACGFKELEEKGSKWSAGSSVPGLCWRIHGANRAGSPSVMYVLRLLPGGHCKPKAMLSVQALNNLQS